MKRRKPAPPRRRNAHAAVVRRYGHRIEVSAKAYKRRPKHRNPRQSHDGGFDLAGAAADVFRHAQVCTVRAFD